MRVNLLKLSNSLQTDANLLLRKTQLIQTLAQYGKVSLSGSYSLGLMLDGDIDIFIIDKKINKPRSVNILKDLITQNKFHGYLYYDWTKRRRTGFPKAYYIGLKTDFKGRKWKVDIWLLNKIYKPAETLMNLVQSNLNQKHKKMILDLKYQAKNNNLDLSSSDIYKQVIYGK